MNKYKVKINHVFYEVLDVEAENEEGARAKALEELQKPDHNITPYYQTSFPTEQWEVITEEQFQKMIEDFQTKIGEKMPTTDDLK